MRAKFSCGLPLGPQLQEGMGSAIWSAVKVVPAALVGTDRVMPLGGERLRPAPVGLHLGPAIPLDENGSREALVLAHQAIATLLPPHMRPAQDTLELV